MFKIFGQTWKLNDNAIGGLIVLGAVLALPGFIFIPERIVVPVFVGATVVGLLIFIVVSARVKPSEESSDGH